nr:homeobox-leucine zipper protein HAT22-like [Ipomoea trifida]
MGLEDIYSTKLTLSLGSDDVPHREYDDHHLHRRHVYRQNKRSKPSPISDNYLPSLSLGLPWELKFEAMNDCCLQQASPAPPSSFSDSSLKREREIISGGEDEELEAEEKGSAGDEYQDEEVVGTRKKLRLNKEQSVVLEDSFKQHTTLNSKQKQELARRLSLRPRQVEVWFQNRRARTKLKQTEVDYEVLRKCYETLTDENRRLHKELQELKAANNQTTAPPFHMAATLSMCPSCERTYGGSTDSSAKFSISAAAGGKSHFFRSFLNPSAAC